MMFESMDEKDTEEKEPANYTGVIIGVIAIPFYFFFKHLGGPEMGLSAFICIGMILFAIGLRWELRNHFWFWATIVFVLLLHVPVVLLVPWPHMTINRISLLPIGVADLLVVMGAVSFVEKFVVKYVPPDEEE
jgi:hypothetical protein